MLRHGLSLFLLSCGAAAQGAGPPAAGRIVLAVATPPWFEEARVGPLVDAGEPTSEAAEAVKVEAVKVEAGKFELNFPAGRLPRALTVTWSPHVVLEIALPAIDLPPAGAGGSPRRVEFTVRQDGTIAEAGAAPAPRLTAGGRFGGRAGAKPPAELEDVRTARAAADRGVGWLVAAQEADGTWPGAAHGAGPQARGLATAAACLALLARGSTFTSGPQQRALRRGLCALVERLGRDGTLDPASAVAPLEEQAMVALVLAEAFGLSAFEPLRAPASRAHAALGTMLRARTGSDRRDSCALALATMASVSAQQFLGDGRDALAGATADFPQPGVDPLGDAAALLAGQFLVDPRLADAERRVANVLANLPARGASLDAAYVYFATYALHQTGEPAWSQWRTALAPALRTAQVEEGDVAGSWPPSDPRAELRGRAWTTAMRVLAIAAFDRFAFLR